MRFCRSSGSKETTTEVACLDILAARSLLSYLAALISTTFALRIDFLRREAVGRRRRGGRQWGGSVLPGV